MALVYTLVAKKRVVDNKGRLHKLRQNGDIPGIIYGEGKPGLPIYLNGLALSRHFMVHGVRGLYSVEIENELGSQMAVVRDVQKNSVTGKIVHVDFLRVNMSERIHARVPVHIHGEEEVIKRGELLQIGLKEIDVECLPGDLPEYISYDVSALATGDKILVGNLEITAAIKLLSDAETLVATIVMPSRKNIEGPEDNAADETPEDTGDVS